MKILIVHNDYGKYSGEEAVVDKMTTIFRNHGHEVCFYRKTSVEKDTIYWRIIAFFSGIYSYYGVKGLRQVLEKEKPDIVNVHNLFPFISSAALFECKKYKIPVVMTVHNFRLICPTGLFMRDRRPCELCLKRGDEWGCIRYNCEHSFFKSLGYALRSMYARCTKSYLNNVDYFACITQFQKHKLIAAGYPSEKIVVIPNSVEISSGAEVVEGGEYIAYCGRLSEEKGIDLIIEVAKRHPEIKFKFAGELRESSLWTNKSIPSNCELLGYLSGNELKKFYRCAAFCVMASKWYEGFPMSILEAASFGKCTIAPKHGGFTEIIGTGDAEIGRLFIPMDVDDLEREVVFLWNDTKYLKTLNRRAFEKVSRYYSMERIYSLFMDIFDKKITTE